MCDHEHQVKCEDSVKYYKNDEKIEQKKTNFVHQDLEDDEGIFYCLTRIEEKVMFTSVQPPKVKRFGPKTPRRKREKKIPSKIDGDTNKKGKPSTLITRFDTDFAQVHLGNLCI